MAKFFDERNLRLFRWLIEKSKGDEMKGKVSYRVKGNFRGWKLKLKIKKILHQKFENFLNLRIIFFN